VAVTEYSDSGSPQPPQEPANERIEKLYRELRSRRVDTSGLADLVIRYGSEILEREVPYIVVALRHIDIDARRRELRQLRVADRLESSSAAPFTDADPADVVLSRTSFDEAITALRQLDEADAWALWWHAAGFSDQEIAERWRQAGFQPTRPSSELLRKRRQRAREQLREIVKELSDH